MTFLDELITPVLSLAPPATAEKDCEYWRYPRTSQAYAEAVKAVQDVICAAYGTTPEQLLGRDKHQRLAWARHLTFYFLRAFTGEKLAAIGRTYDRDVDTIEHGVNVVKNLTSIYPRLAAAVQELQRQIEEKLGGR